MLADGDTDPKMSWSKQEIYELDVLNSLLSIVDGGSFQETYIFFFMGKDDHVFKRVLTSRNVT